MAIVFTWTRNQLLEQRNCLLRGGVCKRYNVQGVKNTPHPRLSPRRSFELIRINKIGSWQVDTTNEGGRYIKNFTTWSKTRVCWEGGGLKHVK